MVDKAGYEKIKKSLGDMKEKVTVMEKNFEKKVSEHPIQSLAIAFGTGALVGALAMALMRRR